MPYNTNWHNGSPVLPHNNTNQRAQHTKETPDPLKKTVNIADDTPWCIICQMPHSQSQCMIAQSLYDNVVPCNECNEPHYVQDDDVNMLSLSREHPSHDADESTDNEIQAYQQVFYDEDNEDNYVYAQGSHNFLNNL